MNKNKKLIYITYQTFPANTANSLQTISNIKYMIKNNIDVNLIFPLREANSSDNLNKINNHYGETLNLQITGTKHGFPFGKIKILNRFFYLISHFLWSKNIVKNVTQDSESNYFTRSDWVFYFLSKKGIPVIFECHQYTKLRKYLISLSLRSDHSKIIFLNKNLKEDYEKKFSLKDNFLILQNGVDIEMFTENYKTKKQVIFVGRLTRFGEDRGLYFLINSFLKLDDSYSLKIIGANEDEVMKFKKYVEDLNLSRRVEINEYLNHKDVLKYISESEIGILINSKSNQHSTKYTSPLKYFEYLAGDVKIVATDFDAHKKLPYSENICFFETDNEESLLKAILEVEHKPLLENEEKKLISLDYRAKKILSLLE